MCGVFWEDEISFTIVGGVNLHFMDQLFCGILEDIRVLSALDFEEPERCA